MGSRLTLTLEPAVIESARRHARRSGTTVSRLVSDYIRTLDAVDAGTEMPDISHWPPGMQSLVGLLAGCNMTDEDVDEARYQYLMEKYR